MVIAIWNCCSDKWRLVFSRNEYQYHELSDVSFYTHITTSNNNCNPSRSQNDCSIFWCFFFSLRVKIVYGEQLFQLNFRDLVVRLKTETSSKLIIATISWKVNRSDRQCNRLLCACLRKNYSIMHDGNIRNAQYACRSSEFYNKYDRWWFRILLRLKLEIVSCELLSQFCGRALSLSTEMIISD